MSTASYLMMNCEPVKRTDDAKDLNIMSNLPYPQILPLTYARSMHSTPLQPILQDIRTNVGPYAILDAETLRKELEKREYGDAEAASRIMEDMHDIFITTRTKLRYHEGRNG